MIKFYLKLFNLVNLISLLLKDVPLEYKKQNILLLKKNYILNTFSKNILRQIINNS